MARLNLISINGQIIRQSRRYIGLYAISNGHSRTPYPKKQCWLPLSSAAFILLSPLKNQSKYPIIVDMEKLLIYVGQMRIC